MSCHAIEMPSHILGFRQTTDDRRLCLRRDGECRIHVECWFDVVGYAGETRILSCTKEKRREEYAWEGEIEMVGEHTSCNKNYVLSAPHGSNANAWWRRILP